MNLSKCLGDRMSVSMRCSLPLKSLERILVYRTSTHSAACNLQEPMSEEHIRWAIFISHTH